MIKLRHSSGVVKECPTGYSITTLLFGCFVPLFRGDIKWAVILFGIIFIAGGISVGVGSLIADTIFAAFYNSIYIRDLLQQGYRPADSDTKNWLIQNGILEYDQSIIQLKK